jgi:antitoxin component YwqK of YwqJK toxin-antitoxin module
MKIIIQIFVLIFGIVTPALSQIFEPCHVSEMIFDETWVKFYPDCYDSTTYTVRKYGSNGVLWRTINYKNNKKEGLDWYLSSGTNGNQSYNYINDIEVQYVDYYQSGIPRYVKNYVSDSIMYTEEYHSNGNPKSAGYIFKNSRGEHKQGKWIEYDSLGFEYWSGLYLPTDSVYTEKFSTGSSMSLITEVKDGVWTHYNSNGDTLKTILYRIGKQELK